MPIEWTAVYDNGETVCQSDTAYADIDRGRLVAFTVGPVAVRLKAGRGLVYRRRTHLSMSHAVDTGALTDGFTLTGDEQMAWVPDAEIPALNALFVAHPERYYARRVCVRCKTVADAGAEPSCDCGSGAMTVVFDLEGGRFWRQKSTTGTVEVHVAGYVENGRQHLVEIDEKGVVSPGAYDAELTEEETRE